MEKRNLFQTIFGTKKTEEKQNYTTFKLLNTYSGTFNSYNGDMWQMDIIRSSVDAIARNVAKLKAKHVVMNAPKGNSRFEKLLQVRPNPYMEAYSFWYKIAANYFLNNNAFIYPVRDNGVVTAFYPILASTVELLENSQGKLYARFNFKTGTKYICAYDEIIHLRRHFYDNDLFGSNNNALSSILETINTFNQSMSLSAQLVSVIKGILTTSSTTKSADLKAKRDQFIEDNMSIAAGNSGVIIMDDKMTYTPLKHEPSIIPKPQIDYVKGAIYDYFGVNEDIIQNKFEGDSWEAFYEGCIEPFAIQASQALTNYLFTEREQGFGNEIILEANRLQYVSTETKLNVISTLGPLGLITINEGREIFNMGSVEDGDKRLVSLNYVSAEKQDEYQEVDNGEQKEEDIDSQEDDREDDNSTDRLSEQDENREA